MSKTIVLKKGLDVPVSGSPEKRLSKTVISDIVAIQPEDFKGLLPRLLVKEGDRVLAGSPVLSDKKNPDIIVAAPTSGTVKEVVRGEKRKLLAVLIQTDGKQEYLDFGKKNPAELSAEEVKSALLAGGLWPVFVQRPYGIIADPALTPKGIFVSAINAAPAAADVEFAYGEQIAALQAGIDALGKICPVHISFDAKRYSGSNFSRLKGCEVHLFQGKYPVGNVGVQISHISPIRKDETVWTVSMYGLAAIGKLFLKGRYDMLHMVAVGGPAAIQPAYISTLPGMPFSELKPFYGADANGVRLISGNIFSGRAVGEQGYLRFADDCITIIKEGTDKELLGWARPFRFNQYSADHTYFNWCLGWLTPGRKYDMDTNLHGGPRAFVMSDGYYSKYLPMDIYPIYLAKACLAGDIEKMEKFGIYEVLPEDLAICEYVDPSKNYIQEMIAKGIDLMLKEMA